MDFESKLVKIKTKIGIVKADINVFKTLTNVCLCSTVFCSVGAIENDNSLLLYGIAGIYYVGALKYKNQTNEYETKLEELIKKEQIEKQKNNLKNTDLKTVKTKILTK